MFTSRKGYGCLCATFRACGVGRGAVVVVVLVVLSVLIVVVVLELVLVLSVVAVATCGKRRRNQDRVCAWSLHISDIYLYMQRRETERYLPGLWMQDTSAWVCPSRDNPQYGSWTHDVSVDFLRPLVGETTWYPVQLMYEIIKHF